MEYDFEKMQVFDFSDLNIHESSKDNCFGCDNCNTCDHDPDGSGCNDCNNCDTCDNFDSGW